MRTELICRIDIVDSLVKLLKRKCSFSFQDSAVSYVEASVYDMGNLKN